ncbi:unnamed protein product [Arabis nemorensis]|uniref:Uncharacterized protein n=1 Tax=Arabis nemorensis TaxID=586526 RepID=A0A565B7W2_9BRAS|nr:unnamed protein product [Arabis nemorensis]
MDLEKSALQALKASDWHLEAAFDVFYSQPQPRSNADTRRLEELYNRYKGKLLVVTLEFIKANFNMFLSDGVSVLCNDLQVEPQDIVTRLHTSCDYHLYKLFMAHRLYTIDPLGSSMLGSSLIVFDPEEKDWVAVKGIHGLPKLFYPDAKMTNFGGKLVILGASERYTDGERDILCVEIGLERRQGGEIRGNVESVKCVLTSLSLPTIDLCRTVTVIMLRVGWFLAGEGSSLLHLPIEQLC